MDGRITYCREECDINEFKTVIYINTYINSFSIDDDIYYFQYIISQEKNCIEIGASSLYSIPGEVFYGFAGHSIMLKNVIVTNSITTDYISTNCKEQDLSLLNARKLNICYSDEIITIPASTEELTINIENDSIDVCGHDNLKYVSLIGNNCTAHLIECNNLEKVTMHGKSAYIHGEFMNYLSTLGFNCLCRADECILDHPALFKNINRYEGDIINPEILKALGNIREMQSNHWYVINSIDDIPDSIEVLDTIVINIKTYLIVETILKSKPNIRMIGFFVNKWVEDGEDNDIIPMLKKYPNVEFLIANKTEISPYLLRSFNNHKS